MEQAPITLPSLAKINLYLHVAGKRADGYHELCTVFQTVSLRDEITFNAGDDLILKCDEPAIPANENNLILKAANALREYFNISAGAEIRLKKRIPAPGGLGGGSSNAAVALLGLARLWKIDVPLTELHELAAGIGADVPFFLYGGTALGLGRGTKIELLPDLAEPHILIVTPETAISTATVFKSLDAPNLTSEASNRILQICRFEAESCDFRSAELTNDLEKVTFAQYPEVAEVKRSLLELGARQALMSGSGASVFGIFEKEETRQAAMKALDERVNWRKFAVATVLREEYRKALGLVT